MESLILFAILKLSKSSLTSKKEKNMREREETDRQTDRQTD